MDKDTIKATLKPIYDQLARDREAAGQNGSFGGQSDALMKERMLNWAVTLLSDAFENTDGDGGQDRKYKFEDGQFVNRISGEPIPEDEPTVIFRARDTHALPILRDYAFLIHDPHHKKAVQDRIDEFEKFAMDHPERMKEPGVSGHMQLNEDLDQEHAAPADTGSLRGH